jgi:hypothetical protein
MGGARFGTRGFRQQGSEKKSGFDQNAATAHVFYMTVNDA